MGSQMVFFIARLLIVPIILIIPIMFIVLLFKIFFSTKKNAEQLEEIKQTQKQILRELRPNPPVSTPEIKTVQTPPPIVPAQAIKPAYTAELQKIALTSSPVKTSSPPAVVSKPQIKPKAVPASPSQFEEKASAMVNKIWSWLIVGEGHRMKGVSTEYAVATTWLVRVGIIIILCGSAFFLKYSIENEIMPPAARVAISVIVAIAMLLVGMRITGKEKKYDLIGRGVLGGSIVLLYFSIHSAANMYHLVDVKPAFGLMVLITAVAWLISIRKDSLLVAVLGLSGGTLTPVILSTGVKNLPGLYVYMLMIAVGALAVSRYRNWKLLNILNFVFTWGIYLLALDKFYNSETDFIIAITFLSIYFIVFFGQTLIFNVRNREPISLIELGMILLNTILLFYKGWELTFELYPRAYGAFFSLGAAAFFLIFIIYFLYRKYTDRNLLLILFALTAFSITVSFPLLLSGKWVTFSWSALAVVFLWLGLRIGSRFLAHCSLVIYLLALFRLLGIDESFISVTSNYFIGMFDRLITVGGFCAALAAGWLLLRKHGKKAENSIVGRANDIGGELAGGPVTQVIAWSTAIVLICYLSVEALRASNAFYLPLREPSVTLIWLGAIVLMAHFAGNLRSKALTVLTLIAGTAVLLKLMFDMNTWNYSVGSWTYRCAPLWDYAAMRTLEFIAMIATFVFCMKQLRGNTTIKTTQIMGAATIGLLFIYLTFEASTMMFKFIPGFRSGGVSILWGIFAFALIWGGLRKSSKSLRYAGLLLFSIDALKIFFVDLEKLSQLYRIVAFIILGIVMIAGAFIYIRFREQFETAQKPETNQNEADVKEIKL